MRALQGKARLACAADALAELGGGFNAAATEILLAALAEEPGIEARELAGWPEDANTCFLRASLAMRGGDLAGAAEQWGRFITFVPQCDPLARLEYSRALAEAGRTEEAARQMQLALEQRPRYAFFPRAQKLISKLGSESATHLRQCRIAVLGTRTTGLLIPVLEACCLRDRIRAEIYQGVYGAIEQEVLDPASGLARFRPDVAFLAMHWRDLQIPAAVEDADAFVARVVEERKAQWQRLSACHVVQFGFDYPAADPYGYLGGRARVLERVNAAMRDEAPAHVSILDAAAVQREAGAAHWQDATLWHSFQQHPSTEALPALADLMAAHLRAVLGLTRKVLVTDLDNTLWKGIIGEDGLNGIQVGPGSAAGEAHAELQRHMRELKSRGILLAVCSKNNPEDARLPFEKHPGMALRLEDFAAFQANWDDKARNLREVARQLSLGLDSFVFLDDNPMEREWIRSQAPEVAVVELGKSPFHYVADLERGRPFFALTLSAEDQARAAQYRSESARKQLQASCASLDDFLAQLQMKASSVPVAAANLARVAQLINKTNQFNLTTRRYTEAQVQAVASDPASWAAAFQLSDRVGDYGLIGVILCRPAAEGEWEIDTWLMSCRTLGRQMERYMFDRLVEAAQARRIRRLAGVYRPTQKNGLVAGLYEQLGFEKVSQSPEETRYRLEVPEGPVRTAEHIA